MEKVEKISAIGFGCMRFYCNSNSEAALGHAVLSEDIEEITIAFDSLYYPEWWIEKYKLVQKYKAENLLAEKNQIVL